LTSPGGAEQLALLRQGLADVALFSPPSSIRAREQGLHEILDLTETNIPFVASVVAIYRPFAAQHEELVKNFVRAFSEGSRRLMTARERAKAVLGQYTRMEDAAALEESYSFHAATFLKGPPYPSLTAIQTIIDLQDVPEARTAKPEDFADLHYVRELEDA